MRRVGDEHDVATRLITFADAVARIEEGADDHDAGHLAVRARGRLQRDAGETRKLRQVLLQLVYDGERALRVLCGRERVQISETRNARYLFIQPRVVLHRTRAERIHAEVYVIVPRRDAREVAHHIHLRDFGHAREIVCAPQVRRQQLVQRRLVHVERRQQITPAPGLRTLEDQRLVLRDVRSGFLSHCSTFKVQGSRFKAQSRINFEP